MQSFPVAVHLSKTLVIRACLLLILLFNTAAPGQAWVNSCTSLCNTAMAYQSYGTGPEDTSCLDACNGGRTPCRYPWYLYFSCVDAGNPPEQCKELYGDAKECSVCGLGEVDGSWSTDELVFVNNPQCIPNTVPTSPPTYVPAGTFNDPWCDFADGIDVAIARQKLDKRSRVLVCEGTYREGFAATTGLDAATTGTAEVVVESVVRDRAVVSGSKNWSGVWQAQTDSFPVDLHNELLYSSDLFKEPWALGGKVALHLATNPTPPPSQPPGAVFTLSTTDEVSESSPLILQQPIPILTERLVTFSVYIRPGAAERFRLEFRKAEGDVVGTDQGSGGAWFSFQLPPGQPCEKTAHSKDAAGFGVEAVGTSGWYRAHLSQAMDTDPTTGDPPLGLVIARLHLVGPLHNGDGADLYGPQIDHRPLDQFATTPRAYFPTSWQAERIDTTVWKTLYVNNPAQKSWPHDWGLARHHESWGKLPPVMRRLEMVFVDGQPLRQELSKDDMEPGSFHVDDGIVYGGFNYKHDRGWIAGQCSPQSPCPLTIMPPSGTNMSTALVEVADQPRLLWLAYAHRWTLRGLHFQHAASAYDAAQQVGCPGNPDLCLYPLNNSAVALINSRDLTVLENRVDWNSSHGLGVGGSLANSNISLIRNTAADNGIGGEFFAAAVGFTVDGEELLRNNWRGARAGVIGHATTGAKYSSLAEGTLRNVVARDNHGSGLWFDTENQAITVVDSEASNNVEAGIYFEGNDEWLLTTADSTSFVVKCLIENNSTGVQGISSSDIRLEENTIRQNGFALSLNGTPRPVDDDNDGIPDRELHLRDWYITSNTIDAVCPQNSWMRYGDELPPKAPNTPDYGEWQLVMESLLSNYNDYSHPLGKEFPGFWIKGLEVDLATWQSCVLGVEPWCFNTLDKDSVFVP